MDLQVALRALRAGDITTAEYRLWRHLDDPYRDLTDEQRLDAVVASCASGAPAVLPVPTVELDGHPVLVPPRHRPRGRKPRVHSGRPPTDNNGNHQEVTP